MAGPAKVSQPWYPAEGLPSMARRQDSHPKPTARGQIDRRTVGLGRITSLTAWNRCGTLGAGGFFAASRAARGPVSISPCRSARVDQPASISPGARDPAERAAVVEGRGGGGPSLEDALGRQVRRSGGSSGPPGSRSAWARSSRQGSRHAGSESWSWSSRQVPFVMRGCRRVERRLRRGAHPAVFQRTFSRRVTSFLTFGRKKRDSARFARHASERRRPRPIRRPAHSRCRRESRGTVRAGATAFKA